MLRQTESRMSSSDELLIEATEELSEIEIITDIVSKKKYLVEESPYGGKGLDKIMLEYGNKELILNLFDYDSDEPNEVTTHVSNKDDFNQSKEKQTTLLYIAAKRIMEQFATEKQKPAVYSLETDNVNMRKWAKTEGQRIFNWTLNADAQGVPEDKFALYKAEIMPKNKPTLIES